MRVPGGNILNSAFKLIGQQPVTYYRDAGRMLNDIGLYVTVYSPPLRVTGSVQAVPLKDFQMLGLDFGSNYVTLYTDTRVLGIARDVSGDIFIFNGRTYQCKTTNNWIGIDGWNSVLAVDVTGKIKQQDIIVADFVVTPGGDYVVTPGGDFVISL